ncbi:MAG: hypothetical protein GEU98_25190 [Pseudonocardiaceae bacterium]|nr:hypothetical protein [Pseudonocardiaceae bacterium]
MNSLPRQSAITVVCAAALAVSITAPASAASAEPTLDIYNNGWGAATFFRDGDKLDVCDQNADGLKVWTSVQKWYEQTQSWQAVGRGSAPSFNDDLGECYRYTIDVEPDSSLIRLHMWAKNGNGTTVKEDYSPSGHA